ncbi:MAG TPA: Lin1244/Lin1753 domain-containing protein [Ignavibacteriales bacterium]|nr:Lin1244/Lin1753 domain-containing protein [Ignavibacteriales bacterium]
MKNNLTYYSRMVNSHNHPKFKMLRAKYGWEGEGRFWALNDIVAEAENCMLDVSKKYTRASVANDLGLSLDQFTEFLNYLVEECELFYYDGNHITNDHLQEDLARVMVDRKEARVRKYRGKKGGSPELLESSPELSKNDSKNEGISEKFARKNIESRVEKSRIEENREERGSAPSSEPLFEQFWTAYPNKRNRDKAEAQWKNLKADTSEGLFGLIMDGLRKYKKTRQWQDPQFIPFAHNWLRDRRWKDDMEAVERAPQKQTEEEPVLDCFKIDLEDFRD